MQAVEHAQRKNRGSGDFGVVGSVKKTHQNQLYVSVSPKTLFPFVISHSFSGLRRAGNATTCKAMANEQ
jgi:hypothetical protein